MEDKIKDILHRRGALHVIDGNRFYTEKSVIDSLNEALRQPVVSGSVCCIQLDIKEAEAILHSLKRTHCKGDNLTISMKLEDTLFEKVIKHYR